MARSKKKSKIWIAELVVLAVLLAVGAYTIRYEYYARHYVSIEGELYKDDEPIDLREQEISPEEYDRICAENPDREILWLVPVCGERVEPDITSYTVPQGASLQELLAALPRLTALKTLDLSAATFTAEELTVLQTDASGITLSGWKIPLQGGYYSPDTGELTLNYTDTLAEELSTAVPLFTGLKVLDLGSAVITSAEAAELQSITGAEVHCSFSFCGVETSWDAETLNLTDKHIEDLTEVEDAILSMPKLSHIDMDGCDVPDAELDALNVKYPEVDVVWTIYVHGSVATHSLRTDADSFCLSRYNATSYPGFDNEGLYALRYCHNMVTLDLGHTEIEDLSMCEEMPHLRFLILGDTFVTDFSPLENCNELYYIEAFLLKLGDVPEPDISALIGKESLKHLNLCYAPFTTVDMLGQLTQLDRLWLKGSKLSADQLTELQSLLPNTEICTQNNDESSVDYFWRHNDAYFEMRDNLNMPYAIAK